MVAKTLPTDVCIFGCFGWLPFAAVHSAEFQFDYRMKWWSMFHPLSHLRKNSFVLHWNNTLNRWRIVVFDQLRANTAPTLNTALSLKNIHAKWWITAFWYLQHLCYLTQLQFAIGQNEFVVFFAIFLDNCQICATWTFSIICVCIITFKVCIPPLNCCFRQSRDLNNTYQAIVLLEQYFFPLESNALSTLKIQIFPLFWKFLSVASLK